jgi:hypothetical protein
MSSIILASKGRFFLSRSPPHPKTAIKLFVNCLSLLIVKATELGVGAFSIDTTALFLSAYFSFRPGIEGSETTALSQHVYFLFS